MKSGLETPVLFLVFRRPDLTRRVFEVIKQARPARLFVAADGPRAGYPGEYEQCQATRDIILNQIDWDCEVRTLLRDKNLGCKVAVSSAIDWFFEQVEEGIILEDDCLPGPSFFGFCKSMLDKYRDTPEVMHISGDNFQEGRIRGTGSYYFSVYSHVWGWASWRRAWRLYDVEMKNFSAFRDRGGMQRIFFTEAEQVFWEQNMERTHAGEGDSWDYQWNFTLWNHNALAVLPNANLVTNIGFGKEGTHTLFAELWSPPSAAVRLRRLVHPAGVARDREADEYAFAAGTFSGMAPHWAPWWRKIAGHLWRLQKRQRLQ